MQNNYKPFHQKYRPTNLDELVGQKFISITLKQAILKKKIASAYLFNGPRGTGKTSSARIFAKSLNCLAFDQPTTKPCGECDLCSQINDGNALDIIEIDAASNTGVENIREIIERALFSPSIARWKVYVIDECHMLSTAASNALLKTLEEPPDRVVFILATTNPERVLNTIQSRCQKFDFKRINSEDIFQHLSLIADKELIKYQDQALKLIAKRSNGGMRDAQSLLDQLSLMPDGITTNNVQNLLGEVSEIDLIDLINSLINNDPESLLISCSKLYNAGNEPSQIITGLLNITRDLLLTSLENKYVDLYYTSIDFQSELNKFSTNLNKSKIIDWHNKLRNIEYQIKTSDNPRLWLEIHLTSLLENQQLENISDNKIDKIIQKGSKSEIQDDVKLLKKENTPDVIQNESKSEIQDDVKILNKENTIKSSDLQEKWELILSKVELPSTRMLLTQQAQLVSIDASEINIALSPNWENMIKSRKVIVENAIKKIFGDHIILNFSSKDLNTSNLSNSKQKTLSQTNDIYPIREIEGKKSDSPKDFSKEESFDNSSKNLADFFNGEIIELDD